MILDYCESRRDPRSSEGCVSQGASVSTSLSPRIHNMYRTEKKMAKKLRQDELHMNGQEFDITALDSAVREDISVNSKMMRLITNLSRELRIKTAGLKS
uniref:Uncharacterized protein n=1 Tax=Tanacetum cinerariifolium TaxID=118510 RepID=A0A699I0A8_TANCI|nr:hypothetical protein [Tanacetum cinerariifolium]